MLNVAITSSSIVKGTGDTGKKKKKGNLHIDKLPLLVMIFLVNSTSIVMM